MSMHVSPTSLSEENPLYFHTYTRTIDAPGISALIVKL